MVWLQLHIPAPREKAERLEEALTDLGASAVTFRDGADEALLEPAPGSTPLWQETVVSALFEATREPSALLRELEAALGHAPEDYRFEQLDDRNWERAWMDEFRPMRFGRRLWIIPGGFPPEDPQAVNLHLDPGLAFGTGTHETTALCLEWLDAEPPRERSVLDYGCGSGVLAIAALLLGAREAVGCDIDPQAVTASRDNALANGVAGRARFCRPAELPEAQFDVVVANILASPLVGLAEGLAGRCRAGGRIALSGLLAGQAEMVAEAYRPWFDLDPIAHRGDWIRISGTRRA